MVTRATQKQAQEYKEKKVQFFKEFVENAEDVEGSARQKKHRQPAAAPASASDELLKVRYIIAIVTFMAKKKSIWGE